MPGTPKPKPTGFVCSECGLDWERHGKKPSLSICVELLKADLVKKSLTSWTIGGNQTTTSTAGNLKLA